MEKVYFFDLKEKDCLFIYEKFLSALFNRIRQIQRKASDDYLTSEFFSSSPEEIVRRYWDSAKDLYNANPLHYDPHNEELASEYLVCRFVGSGINTRNHKIYKKFLNANWDAYKKYAEKKEFSEQEQRDWGKHIVHSFDTLNHKKILERYSSCTSEEEKVRMMLADLKENYLRNEPDGNIKENFEYGPHKLLSKICKTILSACIFIENQGGALAYLRKIEDTINDNKLSDLEKTNKLSKELGRNISGYKKALPRDFFKDMGYEIFAKPDKHTVVAFSKLFLEVPSSDDETSEVKTCDIDEVVSNIFLKMAEALSLSGIKTTAFKLDKIVWLLRSGHYYLHYRGKGKDYRLSDNEFKEFCEDLLRSLQQSKYR
ncbi:hypothetical protein [Parasutterella excrementihominis]|jgi:hypothetical protein|uniref:hypothetical protein n=1 Tax=Parasutterella excrementihominis TaxID=487175 RepID=UPI002675534C|nr:hypothetical protein [Parasutterella excrementihominis]